MQKFRKSFSLRFYKRGAASAESAAPSPIASPAGGRPEDDEDCEDCEEDEDEGGPPAGGPQGRPADRHDDREEAREDDAMEGGLRSEEGDCGR